MFGENFSSYEIETNGKETPKMKHEEQYDKNLDNIKEHVKWEIPNLKSLSKEDLGNYKKIELITHPLYKFLFELCQYDEFKKIDFSVSNEDSFKDILLRYFNKICELDSNIDHDKTYMWIPFLTLMEMVEEIQDYMKPCPEWTIRVFLMPNISGLNQNQILIMNKFLQFFWWKNIYTLNSEEIGNGVLTLEDREFLSNNLPNWINVELQWWYIVWCLRDTIESIQDIKKLWREDIDLKLDFIPSTEPWITSGDGINVWDDEDFTDIVSLEKDTQNKLPKKFDSIDDAMIRLQQCQTYKNLKNSKYSKLTIEAILNEYNIESILDKWYSN